MTNKPTEITLSIDEIENLLYNDNTKIHWNQDGLPPIIIRKEKQSDFE